MRVSETLRLLWAETVRTVTISLRYPTETISALILSALLFLGIFFGARQIGVASIGPEYSLDGMVVSYFAWLLLSSAVGQPSSDIEEEATRGTILGLYTSTHGIGVVLVCRSIATNAIAIVQALIVMLAIMAVTGARLEWTYLSMLSLVFLFIAGLGFGLVLASVTMRLKRTQVLFAPVYLLLLPITFFSVDSQNEAMRAIFLCLPGTPAASLLKGQLTGAPIDVSLMLVSLANAATYAVVGTAAMRGATKKTLGLGVAGHA